jgi:hypothetical protein
MEIGSYYLNKTLRKRWDKIKNGKLAQLDEDRVYIVDGREGTGKSLFTIQQAAYIDPTIIENEKGKILPRITFTPEETLWAIRTSKSTKTHTKVIIFDEAFRGLSSKSALSKINKTLVQAMMEMRQNNLVLFIVSPSFFLLELYPAILRSNTLFHIYRRKKDGRRRFTAFNYKKKALIYQIGIRKGWGYPMRSMTGDFFFKKYPGGDEFEKIYREKKFKSLTQEHQKSSDLQEAMKKYNMIKYEIIQKYLPQRNELLHFVKEKFYPDLNSKEFKKFMVYKGLKWIQYENVENIFDKVGKDEPTEEETNFRLLHEILKPKGKWSDRAKPKATSQENQFIVE